MKVAASYMPAESSFLLLLRYSLHLSDEVPVIPADEWEGVLDLAQEQALGAVMYHGIERMSAHGATRDMMPPRRTLLKWMALAKGIREVNDLLYRCSAEVFSELHEAGFRCCILKGQGNALMYPDAYMRNPGDVDVWVDGSRREITEYVRQNHPATMAEARFQHVGYVMVDDVSVELHFIPCSMNNPFYHRRLMRWLRSHAESEGIWTHCLDLPDAGGKICVPTGPFNVVYQLSHMMHHFFDEGIGLRQMMDYYYVLRSVGLRKGTAGSGCESVAWEHCLRRLGLYKFAGAVMYVMGEVFRLDRALMIVPVDERRGKTLLHEILKGGNFGQHSGLTEHGQAAKYFLKIGRNMKFVRQYPSEALCEPLFRTWHFFWRIKTR